MAHIKHITLADAMNRKDLTQQQLEDASGVDRTWIAKLKLRAVNPTMKTYAKLDAALRELGALRRGEKLVFGRPEDQPESIAS